MYAEILEILTAAASLWVSHHIGEDIPQRDTYLGRVLSRNGFGPLTFSSPQPIGCKPPGDKLGDRQRDVL